MPLIDPGAVSRDKKLASAPEHSSSRAKLYSDPLMILVFEGQLDKATNYCVPIHNTNIKNYTTGS